MATVARITFNEACMARDSARRTAKANYNEARIQLLNDFNLTTETSAQASRTYREAMLIAETIWIAASEAYDASATY